MSSKKLFLLDGHALVYRAHYAFISRPLINSKGMNTGAITGFVRTLWDIMKNQNPSHIAVAFDPPGPVFRNRDFPAYKANRDKTPEDIILAIPYIKSILEGFNIPMISIPDFEADDAIGTIAKQAEKEGFEVYMVTPDKDYAQLVSDKIFMYKPGRQGNEIEILGEKEVLEKWEIKRVDQVIDVLGLQGDSVDNIPGIPGIGAKTAIKLLQEYDSLEGILANTDKLKGKQKENVENFADQGRLSKQLATIKLDVPITFDANAYKIEGFNKVVLTDIFKELEFRSLAITILGDDLSSSSGAQGNLFDSPQESASRATPPPESPAYAVASTDISSESHKYILVDNAQQRAELIKLLETQKSFCFDTETTGIDPHEAELVGLAFSFQEASAYYVPIPADYEAAKSICQEFKAVLENVKIEKIGQNLKYDINILRWYDITVAGVYFDTMIAHYLLEPDQRHKLDYLSEAYLNYKMVPIEDLIGRRGKNQLSMRDIEVNKVSEYAGEDADITYRLRNILDDLLKQEDTKKLFQDIEMPLVDVLSEMEFNGVKIDGNFLRNYSKDLKKMILDKEREIYQQAGVRFNIASPKQVGEVLFDRLKVPYRWRKTSSGQHSTSEEKLAELAPQHEIINNILLYRKFAKLKSTYVDALPLMLNPKTGRIHSSFNQARAATGRLSSENPNLQNIPIKDEAGREIRKAFIPRDKDYVLLAADYSQIELRLIADMSNETKMIEAFQQGLDIHKATAAGVFNVPLDEVTADQRRNAKTVNFSIIYGAGSTNLSRQLGIKRTEARDLIDNYFKQYSGLKKYMDDTVDFAREHGYVNTLLGRKRILRDINSRNGLARSNSERIAINTPIQGTAADMIKVAMINIHTAFKKHNFKSKMIMQVHDELVFDAHRDELELIKPIIIDKMQNAIPGLKVPILVGMDIGENWLEAH